MPRNKRGIEKVHPGLLFFILSLNHLNGDLPQIKLILEQPADLAEFAKYANKFYLISFARLLNKALMSKHFTCKLFKLPKARASNETFSGGKKG